MGKYLYDFTNIAWVILLVGTFVVGITSQFVQGPNPDLAACVWDCVDQELIPPDEEEPCD